MTFGTGEEFQISKLGSSAIIELDDSQLYQMQSGNLSKWGRSNRLKLLDTRQMGEECRVEEQLKVFIAGDFR